jgi:hypothetical protein
MERRLARTALAATLAASVVTMADVSPVAAAPPPDLSATSGVPGDLIEITVPDCESVDSFEFAQVLLISGAAPDEVLAGAGSSDLGTVTIVIPDWVDPADPAVIEASCFSYSDEGEPVVTVHDPVAFDVLPGPGPVTQLATYSRTSLQVGQGLDVTGAGCTLPDAEFAGFDVAPGTDRSGRTFAGGDNIVLSGFGEIAATDWVAWAAFSDGDVGIGIGVPDVGDIPEIEVFEQPTTFTPGTYTSISYCVNAEGVVLIYEPQLLTLTGIAPIDEIDLTADGDLVTLAGTSCTAGPVQAALEAVSIEDLFDGDPIPENVMVDPAIATTTSTVEAARVGRLGAWPPTTPPRLAAHVAALADDGFVELTIDPDPEGAWSVSDAVGFEHGFVIGYAMCGDPFGDGWFYDPQAVVIDNPAPPSPPLPVPPATPAAQNPTYAG